MSRIIVRVVRFCAAHARLVILVGVLLMIGTAVFDIARFSINTDVEALISENLPWHQRQLELSRSFSQKGIVAVVQAPTAEDADLATGQLAQALAKNQDSFRNVQRPDSGEFFERNGLLYGSLTDVKKAAEGLMEARFRRQRRSALPW
jgi:predicted RND superfamily exporter protein